MKLSIFEFLSIYEDIPAIVSPIGARPYTIKPRNSQVEGPGMNIGQNIPIKNIYKPKNSSFTSSKQTNGRYTHSYPNKTF